MQQIENQIFELTECRSENIVISDQAFEKCTFNGCYLGHSSRLVSSRPRIDSIVLTNCVARGCDINMAIIEDVDISNLRVIRDFRSWASVFRRVKLRGRIHGFITLQHYVSPGISPEKKSTLQANYDKANSAFYQDVDWALDISEAIFSDFIITGIPGRLIRRDPATQVLIDLEQASVGEWRDVKELHPMIDAALNEIVSDHLIDDLIIAPKASRHFGELLKSIQVLRKLGIAKPD